MGSLPKIVPCQNCWLEGYYRAAFQIPGGVAQTVQTFCKDRKTQAPKVEYYDAEGNLMAAIITFPLQPQVPVPTSPFEAVTKLACGPSVAGTYEGMNNATYEKGGQAERKSRLLSSRSAVI